MNGATDHRCNLLPLCPHRRKQYLEMFSEPIATAAVQGQKANSRRRDIMVERATIYAIAVKSGTSVLMQTAARNRNRLRQAIMQAKKRFVPIGYGYGKKALNRGLPKFYMELAGKDLWMELTGDEEFYIKHTFHGQAVREIFEELMLPIKKLQIGSFVSSPKSFALRMVALTGRSLLNLTLKLTSEWIRHERCTKECYIMQLFECKLQHQESGMINHTFLTKMIFVSVILIPKKFPKLSILILWNLAPTNMKLINLLSEQRKVILVIRYDSEASEDTKRKYGFYGEVPWI